MWALVCTYSTVMDSFLFYIPFKGKESCNNKIVPGKNSTQANTTQSLTMRSISLREVRLPAVLVTFGFSENLIVDSAQCSTLLDFRKIFWIF